MKRIILGPGVISGLLMAASVVGIYPLINAVGVNNAEIVEFVCLIISFLPILFGVRSYRDKEGQGSITFGRAVSLAMIASLVAVLFYVAAGLILYYSVPDEAIKLSTDAINQMKATGRSQQEIDAALKQAQDMQQTLKNPFVNGFLMLGGRLPVALIFSLIAGFILKKQNTTRLPLEQN